MSVNMSTGCGLTFDRYVSQLLIDMSTHSVSHYSANRCVKYTLIFQFSVTEFPSFGLSRHNY